MAPRGMRDTAFAFAACICTTMPVAAQDAPQSPVAIPAPDIAPAPALVPAPATPDSAPAQQHLDVEYERFRRLTVPVMIDGKGPYRFMIDTGAQSTVVARSVADELGLVERRRAVLIGALSQQEVETVDLNNFLVGDRSFSLLDAPIVEGEHIGGVDGILGVDMLQQQSVLFDFEEPRMAVVESAEAPANDFQIVVRARKKLGKLVVWRAVIDRVSTRVIIDTGAQSSIGNLALQSRLHRADPLGVTSMIDVNGEESPVEMRLGDELKMDDVTIRNVPIVFADSPTFRALDLDDSPALILGMDALRLFRRVAIDFSKGRIMLDLSRDAWADEPLASNLNW